MADEKAGSKARKRIFRGAAVGLAVFALAVLLNTAGAFRALEWKSWDARLKLLADPGRASADIVLMAVDQPSLDAFEKEQGLGWPWPRQMYAPIFEYLSRADAVFFDVLTTEPSSYGVEDDTLLAHALKKANNPKQVLLRVRSGEHSQYVVIQTK